MGCQYDNLQKAAFLRELGRTWEQFDQRVLCYKVLPPLLSELKNSAVQALTLPLVLTIASKQDPEDFMKVTHACIISFKLCNVIV